MRVDVNVICVMYDYNIEQSKQGLMQTQQSLEKAFFQEIKPGDYVDARFADDDWKVAKVIDRQNKYLTLQFDGFPPNNQQVYINPMRVKPLRALTVAYTGPVRGIYSSITAFPELLKYTDLLDSLLKTDQAPSPYRVTHFLRGELFCNVNLLLMSDLRLSAEEATMLNNFFIQLIDRIGKICQRVKRYLPDYFQANSNNKFAYLTNFKLATVWSLQELLYLLTSLLGQSNQMPRLLKVNKNDIQTQNLLSSVKQYLGTLVELGEANDLNGRWLPTFTRLNITKILMKFKQEDKIVGIAYSTKDYLEYYNYWPALLQVLNSEANEKRLIEYIQNAMCKPSPFDAKLKSLVIVRKILEKQLKLNLPIATVVELLNSKKIVDSLLKSFNPEIFKRYIPILKVISEHTKKTLTQGQVDDLFKIMRTSHDSEINIIYEIIVSISEFISVETLDNIYADIEKTTDINCENSIKFVRDFTIKAIQNFNINKNRGFFNALIGRKKNSSKFGYYGLDLFFKEMQDASGKILPRNIAFVITNMGIIFMNQYFHHERMAYMQLCIANIDKRESYGQSVKLLGQILCTYPFSAYIGETQESVLARLDEKHKLVDTLIKCLKPLEKQSSSQTSKAKVSFELSIKYCYNFLQQFGSFFKHPLQLRHINHLWHMPYIFQFLRKSKEGLDSQIPMWKKKYYKKLSEEIMKGILLEIIKVDENIILTEQCFDAINELIIAFNLNKSIELTERATVRYKNLGSVTGLNFYYKFLDKLILASRNEWRKNRNESRNNSLTHKVIKTIFQFHLRPTEYYAFQAKCENWIKCLMKVAKSLNKENSQICASSIELFLDLIQGRQLKDISATGKLDILVSWEGKEKTITLPKGATILKLRMTIMEAYKIKWNFDMYHTGLKRQIKFSEEEDFSVYAMGLSTKGPTILVKRVQQKQQFPLFEAEKKFMDMLEVQQQFYQIVFGLLHCENINNLHSRIWKVIQRVPVNRATKQKIKNCKEFSKKNWEEFLLPKRMEELQYCLNIVYSLLATTTWMEDFKKTQGNLAIEELYLAMLGSRQVLSQKITIKISKILQKILEHGSVQNPQKKSDLRQEQKGQQKQSIQNLWKISQKIMQFLQKIIEGHENKAEPVPSIECLNLMMKMLISSSLKKNCPEIELIINFFINNKILFRISDIVLFEPKDNDSTFFTEEIIEKVSLSLNLDPQDKFQIFRQFITRFLDYESLAKRKSTQNYFIYLIDFLHSMDRELVNQMFMKHPEIVQHIQKYVEEVLDCQTQEEHDTKKTGQRTDPTEEMLHGCFKLLNQTYTFPVFNYDIQRIFNILVQSYVLSESYPRSSTGKGQQKRNQMKTMRTKLRSKKILYEMMKSMIFSSNKVLKIFVDQISPKLQTAEWRRNVFSSWSLEQQKREKRFFCGLENLAATCYINCLFQQLFMIKRFTDRFISIDSLAYRELQEGNQIYQLQKLLVFLKYGNKRSYTTRPFCQSFITYQGLPIDPTVQNDADQFFNALMEKVQAFLKSSGHHYILEDTFEGKLSNQLNCEGCPHSSQKIESFTSIGLNIKNKKTLESALDGYVEGEILDGDNAYFCEICQKKVRTMKRLCIKQVPNILVIVLKRFTFNFDEMRKIKINEELKFPQDLNIKKYTSQYHLGEECMPDQFYAYRLRGVVIHSGTSEGGHYYSFIKEEAKEREPKWYEFNDQTIEEAEYKRIEEDGFGGEEKDTEFKIQKHKSAYILLYEKQLLVEKECKEMQLQHVPQSSFEDQLAEMVKSENRSSNFLSIMLDQSFVRLCENIAMCGDEKAHHFIILYFHAVLLRDRNKEDYLANIYRIILTLLNISGELSCWFLSQINQNYIREFLIEAPKLTKYLCLGLVIEAIKVTVKCQSQLKSPMSIANQHIQLSQNPSQTKEHQAHQDSASTQPLASGQPLERMEAQNKKQDVKMEVMTEKHPSQLKQSSSERSLNDPYCSVKPDPQNEQDQSKMSEATIARYQEEVKKLIKCLLYCLKSKGMSPLGKIFTFLSSLPVYRQQLSKYQYAERAVQIILASSSQFFNQIQYEPRQSYLGKLNEACKQKELELSHSFLIQSLRYYTPSLTKEQIQGLLSSTQSRAATKTLLWLLAKATMTSEDMLMSLEAYKLKLLDDKYKREDVERFALMVRYYFLVAEVKDKKSEKVEQLSDTIKSICVDSLAAVIKSNENSYLLMEIIIIEINKLASRCLDFRSRWVDKVASNQGVYKVLQYWVAESRRPHFLQRAEQWKRKTSNMNFQQKDILVSQNQAVQEQRTSWMFTKRQQKQRIQKQRKNKKIIEPSFDEEQGEGREAPSTTVPDLCSDIELAEINKDVIVGFRTFKIIDRLGILTKVEDEKGMQRWAILERNDVETYIDF